MINMSKVLRVLRRIATLDAARWVESDHPRDKDGRFASEPDAGGGSGGVNHHKAGNGRETKTRKEKRMFGGYAMKHTPSNDELAELSEKRMQYLREHPEKKLPGASTATISPSKFSGYLFNPEKSEGYAKGLAFTDRLGYTLHNSDKLSKALKDAAAKYPCKWKTDKGKYGVLYEQKVVLSGPSGNLANVTIGWCVDGAGTHLTTAHIEEVGGNDD